MIFVVHHTSCPAIKKGNLCSNSAFLLVTGDCPLQLGPGGLVCVVPKINLLFVPLHSSSSLICCIHLFSLHSPVKKFATHVCASSLDTYVINKHLLTQ